MAEITEIFRRIRETTRGGDRFPVTAGELSAINDWAESTGVLNVSTDNPYKRIKMEDLDTYEVRIYGRRLVRATETWLDLDCPRYILPTC